MKNSHLIGMYDDTDNRERFPKNSTLTGMHNYIESRDRCIKTEM